MLVKYYVIPTLVRPTAISSIHVISINLTPLNGSFVFDAPVHPAGIVQLLLMQMDEVGEEEIL
jgi:hypothetical protein